MLKLPFKLNQDQVLSMVRTALNNVAGGLIAKGLITSSQSEVLIAAIIVLITLAWGHFTHKDEKANS